MKNFIKIVMVLSFILSCGDKGTNGPQIGAGEIVPLEVSNFWVYENPEDSTVLDTTIVLGDTLIDDITWYRWKISATGFTVLVRNMEQGLQDTSNSLIYKYPASIGDEYNNLWTFALVESINTEISTSLGNYSCYKYVFRTSSDMVTNIIYASAGVGVIRAENRSGMDFDIWELKEINF